MSGLEILLPSGSTEIAGVRSQIEGIEDLWKHPDVENTIRMGLKGDYDVFIAIVQEMIGFMKEIMEILGVSENSKLKQHMKIKFALRKGELKDHFEDLERTSRSLSRLSKQALELEATAVFASKYQRPDLNVVRECAEGEGGVAKEVQERESKKRRKKGVRFAAEAKEMISSIQEPTFHSTPGPIQDLCMSIGGLQKEQRIGCFGFLMDAEKKRKCSIYSVPSAMMKLNIALIVAPSVLQLYQTPWLDETWGKEDILFMQRPGGEVILAPFVSRQFSTAPSTRDGTTRCTNIARNRLVRNTWLFALGVLLIVLCYGRSLEDLRIPEDGGDDSGVANWDLFAAFRLRKDEGIFSEAGGRYGDAVRRCIRCDFEQRVTDLDTKEFRVTVYDRAIVSLEEDWRQFRAIA
ncbi:uncharacterized protein BDZ99DRAFT_482153 [Mytilinidion resinicola]|uniref:DUF7580 domain-containing protein n=1 Tax=Mytilinidion resinicola TaxID=574789 RepID=A0A6A6Y450_9PEZI|nr:uncharacterized protein BDZ99DRAFT_482153 [Mytilinidion resinicola]KAF2803298.1 hypothetical protein BDZ99DRAFT_482153 [Mytilinidion resinicola]